MGGSTSFEADIEFVEMPDELPAYGLGRLRDSQGRMLAPSEPYAREGARLLAIARRLGQRVAYAMRRGELGPNEVPCDACGHGKPGRMPDKELRETFQMYSATIGQMLKEQRMRIELVLKYKLKRDLTDKEIRERIREIVSYEIGQMADDELSTVLESRRLAQEVGK